MPKVRKEPLIPVGMTLECDCGAEMECVNPQALEEFVYSCPRCGATYTSNLLFPRVSYTTKEEMLKELREQGQQDVANKIENADDELSMKQKLQKFLEEKREIQELISRGDYETLAKMGIRVMPIFHNPNDIPS